MEEYLIPGDGRMLHGALFKAAKTFKKSKQTKQWKRKCNNDCTARKIAVAIRKTLKLDERTENISVAVEGQSELQKRETLKVWLKFCWQIKKR